MAVMDASVIKRKAKAKLIFSIKTDTLTNEGKGRKHIVCIIIWPPEHYCNGIKKRGFGLPLNAFLRITNQQ